MNKNENKKSEEQSTINLEMNDNGIDQPLTNAVTQKLLKVKTMENIYQKFGKKFNINQAKNMLSPMHFRDNTTKNIFI